MAETAHATPPAGKYLVDSYEEWAKGEAIPIVTGACLDLPSIETRPWARFGLGGAFCHVEGRDDFLTVLLLDLGPGAGAAPQRHLFEAVFVVLAGTGAVELELAGGARRLEWGPDSVFAVPMNARYRLVNSGAAPARLALFSDLRYLLNLYRSERFLFASAMDFPERQSGEVLVRDIASLPLGAERARRFDLAAGSLGCDLVELAPHSYGRARRQMQGAHLLALAGPGYTLIGSDTPEEATRIDWHRGTLFAAPGMRFGQHFNPGPAPARLLDVEFGSEHYPLFRSRRAAYGDGSVYAAGRAEIAREQEDPRIALDFTAACTGFA
jgi:mannose-6-phosphate isomerase-like protein (cupin superfamily)